MSNQFDEVQLNQAVGAAVVESLDLIETTSVDGRTYASIEDLLSFTHAGIDDLRVEVSVFVQEALDGGDEALVTAERGHAMLLAFQLMDSVLHAADDREGLESLSPGDFKE